MRIKIATLKEGPNSWRESSSPAELGLDPEAFRAETTTGFEVERRSSRITVLMTVSAAATFPCDRCGDNATHILEGESQVVFIRRDQPLPDEADDDELRTFQLGQEWLEVEGDVRDAVMLAIPFRWLCRTDCRGICPRCWANLNREECRCLVGSAEDPAMDLDN